ncbi:MAG: DUF6263 family protein [Ferruginibacter sp.]
MKRIYISFVCLFISGLTFAQPSATGNRPDAAQIKLSNGQKIVIESNTEIQASLTMGMELNSSSSTVNALQVKNSTASNYTISSTLTKMKVNMNMMGQSNTYNSDNKEGNSEEMAKVLDEKMNKQVDVLIDSKTGVASTEKKKDKKADDADNADPTAGLMKMFVDNSDEAVVASAFEIVPKGKSVGDSWADSTTEKDSKTVRTYTLKSLNGNDAVIQSVILSTGTTKLNFQEMEFEVKSETKSNGEILMDISTGLVKKRTNAADISGSIQMMGQDMPISAKATTTSIYK